MAADTDAPDQASKRHRARRARANRILQQHSAALRAAQPAPLKPHPPSHPPPDDAKLTAQDPLIRAKQSQIVLMQPVGAAVTFSELRSDVVIALAERAWGPSAPASAPFDPRIVSRLYTSELARPRRSSSVALRRMQILELSQYLERYLWPHFDAATASPEHVMSIIMMVNEKFREGVPAWDAFVQPAAGDDAATADGAPPACSLTAPLPRQPIPAASRTFQRPLWITRCQTIDPAASHPPTPCLCWLACVSVGPLHPQHQAVVIASACSLTYAMR